MIGNAILTATLRCHNFDPEKSQNPFAYITQICNNAILEELKKEKKRLYVKYKAIEEADGFYGEVDENLDENDFHLMMDGLPSDQRRQFIEDFERTHFNKDSKDDEGEDFGIMEFL